MRIKRHQDVPAVLEVMQRTNDPRLHEIMLAVVRQLHALIREVSSPRRSFARPRRCAPNLVSVPPTATTKPC